MQPQRATALFAGWLVAAAGTIGASEPERIGALAIGLLAAVGVAGLLGPGRAWGLTAGVFGALAHAVAMVVWLDAGIWQASMAAAAMLVTGIAAGAVARHIGVAAPDVAADAPVQDGEDTAHRAQVVGGGELRRGLRLEIARARRYEHTLSLLLVGLEDWPTLVARRGSPAAGRLLAEVAEAARRVVRDVDTVSLYGPDLLAILLPETALPGAAVVAEKIELVARERGLAVRTGAASYPDDAVTSEELAREAEAALDLARLSRVSFVSRARLE